MKTEDMLPERDGDVYTIEHDIQDYDGNGNVLHATVRFYSGGIGITIQGYGNTSMIGDTEIVYLDYYVNKLQLVIHNDHTTDEPMIVDLVGAHHVYMDDGE